MNARPDPRMILMLLGLQLALAGAHAQCPGALGNPFGDHFRWGSGPHTVITWSFVGADFVELAESGPPTVTPLSTGIVGISIAQAEQQVRLAFDAWEQIADVRFREVVEPGEIGMIRVGAHNLPFGVLAHAFLPDVASAGGDVHINSNQLWDVTIFFQVVLHELGHSLGLIHNIDASTIMFFLVGSLTDLQDQDIGYIQDIYGPPIPKITSVATVGSDLVVDWSHPSHGGTSVAAYCPTIDVVQVDRGGQLVDEVDITLGPGDIHALANFTAESVLATLKTLIDGAEDAQTRLFTETDEWVRNGDNPFAGAKAYNSDLGTLGLPLRAELTLTLPFIATPTSLWRFFRAYTMTASEVVQCRYSIDCRTTFIVAETELGSSDFLIGDQPYIQKSVSLGSEDGNVVISEYVYDNFDDTFGGTTAGIHIDEVEFIDVLGAVGAFTTHSNSIPATASTFALNGLSPGEHLVAIHAVYENIGAGTDALPLNGTILPTVSFTVAFQNIVEGDTTVTVTAALSDLSPQSVSVLFTVGGSAANPDDYTISASPLDIPPGNPSADITVTVFADGSVEGCEAIIITMGTPVNATAGTIDEHTIVITDNDVTAPTVTCPADASLQCSAEPALAGTPTAADDCDPGPLVTFSDNTAIGSLPSIFIVTRAWTATDFAGNSDSCAQTIIVQDTTVPNALCRDITVQLDAGGSATVTGTDIDGGSSDNCAVASLTAAPTTGTEEEPEAEPFAGFDSEIANLVDRWSINGSQVAIMHNGNIVFQGAYGMADEETQTPVDATSRFRLASLSKLVTSAAIHTLIADGSMSLDDRMVDLIPHLVPEPLEGCEYPEHSNGWSIDDITVDHLLNHRAGWDREESGDPTYWHWNTWENDRNNDCVDYEGLREDYDNGNLAPVAVERQVEEWLRTPLDFEPGTSYKYSNMGYQTLGRIVEAVSGMTYEDYVHQTMLEPMGITGMELGRTMPEDRAEGEVSYYDDDGQYSLCHYPTGQDEDGNAVFDYAPTPDCGHFALEEKDAGGGWIASSSEYARLVAHMDGTLESEGMSDPFGYITGCDHGGHYCRGVSIASSSDENWEHDGSFSGSSTWYMRKLDDDGAPVIVVIVSNTKPDSYDEAEGTSMSWTSDREYTIRGAVDDISFSIISGGEEMPDNSFACGDLGANTVTLTVTDLSGNTAACAATVTVEDNLPPAAICRDIATQLDVNGTVSIAAIAVDNNSTDNCGVTARTVVPDSFTCCELGRNTVTLTIADDAGNTGSCQATVTVLDDDFPCPDPCLSDNLPPTIACPAATTIECSQSTAPGDTGSATADDCCDANPQITFNDSTGTGACPIAEVITRTWTASDFTGNSASCDQTITRVDTTAPEVVCPTATTIECGGPTDPAETGSATAIDNCDISVIPSVNDVVNPTGSCPDISRIERIWTATDACGNSDSCVQFITLQDTTPPNIVCPSDSTLDCGTPVQCLRDEYQAFGLGLMTLPEPIFGGLITTGIAFLPGLQPTIVERDPPPYTTGTEINQEMFLLQMDGISLSIGLVNMRIRLDKQSLGRIENVVAAGGSFVSGDSYFEIFVKIEVPLAFKFYDTGDTPVRVEAPAITGFPFGDITHIMPPGSVTLFDAGTTDPVGSIDELELGLLILETLACSGNLPTITDACDTDPSFVFNDTAAGCPEVITRTWTATDSCGNSTSCTETFTLTDTTTPTALCQDITVQLDIGGTVTVANSEVDNGSADDCCPVTLEVSPSVFDCNTVGPNAVTLTVTDTGGIADTCQATVTVADDNVIFCCPSCQEIQNQAFDQACAVSGTLSQWSIQALLDLVTSLVQTAIDDANCFTQQNAQDCIDSTIQALIGIKPVVHHEDEREVGTDN